MVRCKGDLNTPLSAADVADAVVLATVCLSELTAPIVLQSARLAVDVGDNSESASVLHTPQGLDSRLACWPFGPCRTRPTDGFSVPHDTSSLFSVSRTSRAAKQHQQACVEPPSSALSTYIFIRSLT